MSGFLPEGDERGARRRTVMHRLTIGGSLLAVVVAAAFILQTTSGTASAKSDSAAAVFGLGRSVVHTTPGERISGSLQVPQGVEKGSVSWKATAGGGRGAQLESGSSAGFSFTAPDSGEVMLSASAEAGGKTVSTSTIFVVREADAYVGIGVATNGAVRVDGGPAVAGEALAQGALVDASRGDITYRVRARADGSKRGTVTFGGTRFTVEANVEADGRVVNTTGVRRDEAGVARTLDADVEHLDGEAYVQVQTPDAVAMVKGTRFRTRVAALASTFRVRDGRLMVVDRFRLYARPQMVEDDEEATVDASVSGAAAPDGTGDGEAADGGVADDALAVLVAGDAPPEVSERFDAGGVVEAQEEGDDVVDELVLDEGFEHDAAEVGGDRLPDYHDGDDAGGAGADGSDAGAGDDPKVDGGSSTTDDGTSTTTTDATTSGGGAGGTGGTVEKVCNAPYVPVNGVCEPPGPPAGPYRLPWYDRALCDTHHRRWNFYTSPALCVPDAAVPTVNAGNGLLVYPIYKFDHAEWGCHGDHHPRSTHGIALYKGKAGTVPGDLLPGRWCTRMLTTTFNNHVQLDPAPPGSPPWSPGLKLITEAFTVPVAGQPTPAHGCVSASLYMVVNPSSQRWWCTNVWPAPAFPG